MGTRDASSLFELRRTITSSLFELRRTKDRYADRILIDPCSMLQKTPAALKNNGSSSLSSFEVQCHFFAFKLQSTMKKNPQQMLGIFSNINWFNLHRRHRHRHQAYHRNHHRRRLNPNLRLHLSRLLCRNRLRNHPHHHQQLEPLELPY